MARSWWRLLCAPAGGAASSAARGARGRAQERPAAKAGMHVCDTPAQGLIGLIGYSYQQVATSFPEAGLQRTPWLGAWSGAIWGCVTDRKVFSGAYE